MTLFNLFVAWGFFGGIFAGYIFNRNVLGLSTFQSATFLLPIFVSGYIGLKLGLLPTNLADIWINRQLAKMSVFELRGRIEDLTYDWPPGLLLAELRSRGEDIQQHLPLVLGMLMTDDSQDKRAWWLALINGYPELARRVGWINFSDSAAECRRILIAAGLSDLDRTIQAPHSIPLQEKAVD
jgi:hypothetical protein